MRVAAEQALVFRQRVLDLGVARQRAVVGDAEALGGLALGGQEVVDAVLGHDARGFLREGAAQVFAAWRIAAWSWQTGFRSPQNSGSVAGSRGLAVPGGRAGRQLIRHEVSLMAVGVIGAGELPGVRSRCAASPARLASGRGTSRHAAQRLAHEVHPDRHGASAAFLAFAERALLVEAHPHRGHQIRVEAVEPGVVRTRWWCRSCR